MSILEPKLNPDGTRQPSYPWVKPEAQFDVQGNLITPEIQVQPGDLNVVGKAVTEVNPGSEFVDGRLTEPKIANGLGASTTEIGQPPSSDNPISRATLQAILAGNVDVIKLQQPGSARDITAALIERAKRNAEENPN